MIRQIFMIILIIAFLLGGALTLPLINAQREMLGAQSFVGLPSEQNPEIILLTHVLGGFRGLLVDAVWLRAGKLQQQEKYWELYQLYDWMGKLEPRIEEIWDFNAWNMSYNLVAELNDSEARWQWIDRAITLIRDQGLKYNPRSAKLMERLAYTYWHKIGADTDLHNYYYKHRLANMMNEVLLTREVQDVKAMRDAPKEFSEVLKDPDVTKFLNAAKIYPTSAQVQKLATIQSFKEVSPDVGNALILPLMKQQQDEFTTARKKLVHQIGARIMRERFKLDRFDVMVDMEETFGKFDWRLPEPFVIYWATLASEADPRLKKRVAFDRLIVFALMNSMRRGNIAYMSPDPNEAMVTCFDLSKIEGLDNYFDVLFQRYTLEKDFGAESLRDAHVSFLQEACFDIYFSGYKAEAQKIHMKLYNRYDKPHPFRPLDEHMLGQVKEFIDTIGTYQKVRGFVDGLINQTCLYLCMNKPDEARKYEDLARRAWEAFDKWDEAVIEDRWLSTKGRPTFEMFLEYNVMNILSGRSPFPPQYIPVLRSILEIPEGAEIDNFALHDTLTPKIVDSSPLPK